MENWKPVVGYEGVYEVSDHGRVRRVAGGTGARPGQVKKAQLSGRGYHGVDLYLHRKARRLSVHGLVLAAFVGPHPAGKTEINHRNGNKVHNRLVNLEYVSRQENAMHSVRVLGKGVGESHWNCKLNDTQVAQVRYLYTTGRWTQYALAARFGVTQSRISAIVLHQCRSKRPRQLGRHQVQGERCGHAKLTDRMVRRIRQLAAQGVKGTDLAKQLGVASSLVSMVKNGQRWKHVV